MTATADTVKPKSKHETWRVWWPDEDPSGADLMTRTELVARLQDEGITVEANDFRYWQAEAVIPHGIRRWHNGKTQTVYPPRMLNLIRQLRRLKDDGYIVRKTGPRLRSVRASDHGTVHSYEQSQVERVLDPRGLEDVTSALTKYAQQYAQRHGVRIDRIDVSFVDANGIPLQHSFCVSTD